MTLESGSHLLDHLVREAVPSRAAETTCPLGRPAAQPLLPNSPTIYVPGGTSGGVPNGAERGMLHNSPSYTQKCTGKGMFLPQARSPYEQQTENAS